MPFVVKMPKLSPTMEEGTIAQWTKKEGDFVEAGEVLLEIATDKATVEHTALDEGYLRKILVPEGGSAKLNDPIAIFAASMEEPIDDALPKKKEAEKKEASAAAEETPQAEAAPKLTPVRGEPAFVPEPPLEEYTFPSPREGEKVLASPLAKRLAKKRGLDLSTVQGTGPGGRITSRDLDKAQPAGIVTFGRHQRPTEKPGSYEEIPLTPMRKVISRRLQESKSYIPHFYVRQEIDAAPLVALREQLKTFGLKVTYNDLILRACALALREHPTLNSGFNSVNQTIIQFKTIDISLAVTVEAGLITPIIRHADYKNLGQLSTEAKQLAEKARQGKLAEQEYRGGSFTLSNLGMYGITEFTAVINPPQAAILAVGGLREAPVVKEGQVVAGKTMMLTLAVDHRVVDGADAAQFMKTLQLLVENPATLAL